MSHPDTPVSLDLNGIVSKLYAAVYGESNIFLKISKDIFALQLLSYLYLGID